MVMPGFPSMASPHDLHSSVGSGGALRCASMSAKRSHSICARRRDVSSRLFRCGALALSICRWWRVWADVMWCAMLSARRRRAWPVW